MTKYPAAEYLRPISRPARELTERNRRHLAGQLGSWVYTTIVGNSRGWAGKAILRSFVFRIETSQHDVPNHHGWQLALRRVRGSTLKDGRRPVAIVPGYGMNSFIFSFHPRGPSMEQYLAQQGLEVWSMDLRAQGKSVRQGGSLRFGLGDLALTDLRCALAYIAENTDTGQSRVDILGASLGATLMYVLAAHGPAVHMGALVSMGGPLRWVEIHPILRLLAGSPSLLGLIRFPETRPLAERAVPILLRRAPALLEFYLHTDIVDTTQIMTMLQTVETPSRHVNRQIARWILDRDLLLEGVNITHALGDVTLPLLCVIANADGVVPPRTARSGFDAIGAAHKEILEVGTSEVQMAHADLFVCNAAHDMVFDPIARWLERVADATF